MALTQRDLEKFFNPRHVAILGVSAKDYRFGGASFLIKLLEGGYEGKLYPINPRGGEIMGLKVYPDLSSLPDVPDLAMVCVPARFVPSVLEECARIGVDHIHILTSGFRETGLAQGRELEEQITRISKDKGLQIIGPNCMGPYCPSSRLTAWGAIPGLSGSLAVISQSGGLTQRITEYTRYLGVGVEKAVSFGNGSVLDSTAFLDIFSRDDNVQCIAMYLESVKDGRRFLNTVREVSKQKPVVLWKGGESDAGAATAASHTGAMSGEQKVWEGLYRQTGVIHVGSMNELVDTVLALTLLPAPSGKGVFLIGGGGGNSVSYSDTCIREGLEVPVLSDSTMKALKKSVPTAGSIAGNPLDMWLTFLDANYLGEVLDLAYRDPVVSMAMVDRLIVRKAFHVPDGIDSNPEIIAFVKERQHEKPTVFLVDSDGGDPDLAQKGATLRAQYCRAGIPAYPSARRAARALYHLHRYYSRRT